MKARPRTIVLSVSCFLAGFLTCYFLTQQPQPQPAPATAVAAPTFAPVAMLTLPTVSTQVIHIDGGNWYRHSDGVMRRTPPPDLQPRRYDLIDMQYQPDVELK